MIMNPEEFAKLEYATLREEIRETKNRIFKLAAIALVGLPAVSAAAEVLKIDLVVLVLPGFIVATLFRLMALNCGLPSRDGSEPSRGYRPG
jgi:hypothetical protein